MSITKCPNCNDKGLEFWNGEYKCLYCGHTIDCKECRYKGICHEGWCKYDQDLLDDGLLEGE